MLREGRRFNEQVQWKFRAKLDEETGKLTIGSLTIDLMKIPLEHAAKVITQLSQLSKNGVPILQKRYLLEGPEGPQGKLNQPQPRYDLELLRECGMNDLAEQREQEATGSAEDPFAPPEEDSSNEGSDAD